MKIILNVFFLCFTLSLLGCIHTSTYSEGTALLVSLKNTNIACDDASPRFRVGAGSHQLISDCIYRLVFEKTNGGSTYFLGKKIKESNPWKDDRMVLTIDNTEYKFSIEDIKKMPTVAEDDSLVYQLNIQ